MMTKHLEVICVLLTLALLAGARSTARGNPTTKPSAGAGLIPAAWASDPVWHDGLVEKATYDASRVVYGKPRTYTAVFLTNKEAHDPKTLTKYAGKGGPWVEVWKFNQVEVIPTPNYDYKYEVTCHLTTDGRWLLTRLDAASQEFCGATFKQYELTDGLKNGGPAAWDYFGFCYLPGTGRVEAKVSADGGAPVVAFNSLPLYLRDFDFISKVDEKIRLLPDQKMNHPAPAEPAEATVRYAGTEGAGHKLEVVQDGKVIGTFHFAPDRLHVMTAYEGAEGQTYKLKTVERTDYWTRRAG